MKKFIVNEIFQSLQGEGSLAGTPSVFIRLAGCPVRCDWCDTRYAWDEDAGEPTTLDDIVEKAGRFDCEHIVLTGGEPMVNPMLAELAGRLAGLKKHITIETAGIAYLPGIGCDLMSISPKLRNIRTNRGKKQNNENKFLNIEVLNRLLAAYSCQLKFVIDTESDIDEALETMDRLENVDRGTVFLMPQAKTREQLLSKGPMVAELALEHGLRFGPRLQVMLWNGQRGR